MAQSTTAVTACDVVIEIADENDILVDISGSSNEFNMSFSKNIGSMKVFGNDFPIRRQCGSDCSIDLTSIYSTALNEARDLLHEWQFGSGGTRRFRVRVPDGSVGGFTYYGRVVLSKMDIPLKADDATPIPIKVSLMTDGDVSYYVTAS